MKKTVYPNQGQPIQDIYITGISRIFLDGDNIICVVESRCGIESESEVYINESARLILPMEDLTSIKNSLSQALSYVEKNIEPDTVTEEDSGESHPNSDNINPEIEGETIAIFANNN